MQTTAKTYTSGHSLALHTARPVAAYRQRDHRPDEWSGRTGPAEILYGGAEVWRFALPRFERRHRRGCPADLRGGDEQQRGLCAQPDRHLPQPRDVDRPPAARRRKAVSTFTPLTISHPHSHTPPTIQTKHT